MEKPHSSKPPEIVTKVSKNLFAAPPTLQSPLLSCLYTSSQLPTSPMAAQPTQVGHRPPQSASWPPAQQVPKAPPTQGPISFATPTQPPLHQSIMTRLTTPTFDDSTDPLSWLSRLRLMFKLHHAQDDQQIRYAAFHQTRQRNCGSFAPQKMHR